MSVLGIDIMKNEVKRILGSRSFSTIFIFAFLNILKLLSVSFAKVINNEGGIYEDVSIKIFHWDSPENSASYPCENNFLTERPELTILLNMQTETALNVSMTTVSTSNLKFIFEPGRIFSILTNDFSMIACSLGPTYISSFSMFVVCSSLQYKREQPLPRCNNFLIREGHASACKESDGVE